LRLSAIRKLAAEAAENGLLDRTPAQGIVSLKGVRQSGDRAGSWLTSEQARDLLAEPDIDTMEGKRDRAILTVLLGCALRRSELAALACLHMQQRDGRWVFVDLVGKGNRIRTVPIPPFVKASADVWTAAAGLSEGPLFRRVRRRKYPEKTPEALSERMIWHIVMKYARKTGLVDKLGPHDLRRTCAKLCRASGGELEQIQFLLGHASIQTTERYLGSRQGKRSTIGWAWTRRLSGVEPDAPLGLDRLGKKELVDGLDDGCYLFPLLVLPFGSPQLRGLGLCVQRGSRGASRMRE
jgi:integrase